MNQILKSDSQGTKENFWGGRWRNTDGKPRLGTVSCQAASSSKNKGEHKAYIDNQPKFSTWPMHRSMMEYYTIGNPKRQNDYK